MQQLIDINAWLACLSEYLQKDFNVCRFAQFGYSLSSKQIDIEKKCRKESIDQFSYQTPILKSLIWGLTGNENHEKYQLSGGTAKPNGLRARLHSQNTDDPIQPTTRRAMQFLGNQAGWSYDHLQWYGRLCIVDRITHLRWCPY